MESETEKLNTQLYEKLFDEQEEYRDWLLSQPPQEILNHAYTYTMREGILLSVEYNDLSAAQAKALLQSPDALSDLFKDLDRTETGHMDAVRDCVTARADEVLRQQREEQRNTPVYCESAAYAHTHDELPAYRASHKANIACKESIEQAIRENYDGSRLNSSAALSQVTEQFGTERMAYVLAATVREKEWDARISRDNEAWTKTVPVAQDQDAWGRNRNTDFVVDQAHSGLVDLFVRAARKEMTQEQSETGRLSLRAQLAAKPPQPQRSTTAKSTKEDFER